jgi:hypothetical protein
MPGVVAQTILVRGVAVLRRVAEPSRREGPTMRGDGVPDQSALTVFDVNLIFGAASTAPFSAGELQGVTQGC